MNPITGIFQVICVYLRRPYFKVDLKRKNPILKLNGYYFSQSIFFFILSRCSLYVELMDGQPLLNTVCLRVRLIKGYMEITE